MVLIEHLIPRMTSVSSVRYLPYQIPLQIKSLRIDCLSPIQDGLHHVVRFTQSLSPAEELDMDSWRHNTVVPFQIIYCACVSLDLGYCKGCKPTVHGLDQVGDDSIFIDRVIARVIGKGAVELDIKVAVLAIPTAVPSSALGVAGAEFVNVRWHCLEASAAKLR